MHRPVVLFVTVFTLLLYRDCNLFLSGVRFQQLAMLGAGKPQVFNKFLGF